MSDELRKRAEENARSRVYGFVKRAIERGDLIRPTLCHKCGDNAGVASDGRSKIHAHHHDYSKPLDVEWLCAKCHRKDTPLPVGDRSASAKLDDEKVRYIRNSAKGSRELAGIFGVSMRTIQTAKSGKWWGWVK